MIRTYALHFEVRYTRPLSRNWFLSHGLWRLMLHINQGLYTEGDEKPHENGKPLWREAS